MSGFPEYEVKALPCPKCGAQIEGSGACPSCSQLLLVSREHGLLNISLLDIQDIKIEAPDEQERQSSTDPYWNIHNWGWPETHLVILGEGDPEVGATLVAKWCSDHRKQIVGGQHRPGWRQIQDYSIAQALKANKG